MSCVSRGMVIVFVRNPEPGAVKTRLERDIAAHTGPEQARELTLSLYEAFVLDTMDGLRHALGESAALRICFDPPEAAASVMQWLGADLEYAPQRGRNLGARMGSAFEEAWPVADRAVLMGSDAPGYPPELVVRALDALDEAGGADAVIAPSLDGGYFAIGFRKESYRRDFFERLAWGGDTVFEKTLSKLHDAGLEVEILPAWNDVDHANDARALLAVYEQGDSLANSRTFGVLAEHRALFERFDIDADSADDGIASLRRRLEDARRAIMSGIRFE